MTRRFCQMIVAAALLTSAVAPTCMAQQEGGRGGRPGQGGPGAPGGFGGRGMGMGMMGGGGGDMALLGLLRIEEVQKEIDLMPDQAEALQKAGESIRGNNNRPNIDFRNASEEEREKFMEQMRKQMEEASKKITEELEVILLPEQLERARQIAVQQQGVNAFFDVVVIKKLELTEDQQAKLREQRDKSMESMRESMRDLFSSGDRDAIGKKMAEMRDKQLADAKSVLNSDQAKKYEEMRGKPFDLPQGAMMGGFGRGGQGGPGGPGQGGPGGRGQRGGDRGQRGNDA